MEALPHLYLYLVGSTALGASGRSNNGLKLDVKTGKLSLWRLFPTFTFTFYPTLAPLPSFSALSGPLSSSTSILVPPAPQSSRLQLTCSLKTP